MTIDEYFTSLDRGLRHGAKRGISVTAFECIASGDFNGLIRCRASFLDRSFLDIYEVVSTELGYPVRVHYSYNYVRGTTCIFRYDNAPHHPEVVTHPHHKHIEGHAKALPSDQPSLGQVLAEVSSCLSSR